MRAIDKMIAHWARTKGQRKTKVYELGRGESLEVWWSPWTLGDMDRVFEGVTPGGALTPKQAARVVALKAEDRDGKRLFADVEEIEVLNEVDPALVYKVATAIHLNFDIDNKAAIPDPIPGEPQEPAGPKA